MIAHTLIIEIFVSPDEDIVTIKEKFINLFPFDFEKEEINLQEDTATGFNQKRIKIFRVNLSKNRHVKAFLLNMVKNLRNHTKEVILNQAEKRLDENFNFFLRFDKNKLLNQNIFQLTEQGDCILIRFKIAAFPKNKENALAIINELLLD
ncbi:MAG: RNA-binding domain-containing protein [Promethearchaeati archaeon]